MSPQKHKYHYLPERERIRQDSRLKGFWTLGHETVSGLQELMARLWPNDTFVKAQVKREVDMPLHWFLTQALEIDNAKWNAYTILWKVWVEGMENHGDGISLSSMAQTARFLDLIHTEANAMERFDHIWKYWPYRDLLTSEYESDQQLRRVLYDDFLQFGAAHPLRNYLLTHIVGRPVEILMGMGYQGGGNFPVPCDYPNGWSRSACSLTEAEQRALVREIARFLDYALPLLEERFGQKTAIDLLVEKEQGLLNFWLARNTPDVAFSVGSNFQKYYENPRLARVNARIPLKRLPLILLWSFGTESMIADDSAHVCRGGSLRSLPSFQRRDSADIVRISPRAAHILSQFTDKSSRDYYKELYRAVCMATWENSNVSDAVARYVEEHIGHGDYNDPKMKQLMLFFKRNQTELEGIRLGHLIDYLYHELSNRPDFSLKGRTVKAMLRRMEEWHNELAKLQKLEGKAESWASSGIKPYVQYENGVPTYVFIEICTQQELIVEGRVMRHCVASYIDGCIAQQYSIWSLRQETAQGKERLLTIQVNRHKAVVQACGPHNREPDKLEHKLLKNWAITAGLHI